MSVYVTIWQNRLDSVDSYFRFLRTQWVIYDPMVTEVKIHVYVFWAIN